jgi:4-methylaminobutanoate oxidase (formaldehyde-forming)
LNDVGIKTVINGPIPVSADGEPIMGLAPEYDNLYVACGFTAGIAASAGAGEAMANWIVDGDPGMDLWQFDVRRFGPPQAIAAWLEERAIEAYGAYYKIHFPNEEMHSARGQRTSPLHARLDAAGAVFGSKFGWERPNWFAPAGTERVDRPSFEQRPNWFEAVAEEHRAIRERVAVIDQTSFAKFELSGPGVGAFLQSIADNDVDREAGSCTYTQLCNERGGIEADLTLMRLAPDLYYGVTGSGFGVRDMGWIAKHKPDGVRLREVTSAYAVINVVGPRARDVLQQLTDEDMGNAAFPYLTVREIELGQARVRAARVGYVGELGWELHVPVEYAAGLYDRIVAAGQPFGIANAGYRAIGTCRMEKGYLYWSADITPETNPYEAGLGFCVRLDKGDFIGREALARVKSEGPRRKLITLTVDGFAPFHGGETIVHDGRVVGSVTSANYGHTVGKTIAFGYVPATLGAEPAFDVIAFGETRTAQRGGRSLYDPKNERLKG